MATSAQFIVNLYHCFHIYNCFPSHELSPLQLFFYGVESPSFWLSKTSLLASFGSDGGHRRFFKENECNQPAGESVSYLPFSRGFPYFSPCFSLQKPGRLKMELSMVYVVSERPAVGRSGPMVDPEGLSRCPSLIPDWPCTV